MRNLILTIDPPELTWDILKMDGYGTIGHFHSNQTYWVWDKEKIRNLNEDEVLKIINIIVHL